MNKKIFKCLLSLLLMIFMIGGAKAYADDELTKVEIENQIWDILVESFDSEVAAAAIMGNLQYESALCPYRYEGLTFEESKTLNDIYKTNKSKFVYSIRGYGLAGWTGCYNLEKLWNFCEENGYSVDDPCAQAKFLVEDVKHYEKLYKRLQKYENEDLVTACEDFRQTYEKSVMEYRAQWCRAEFAKAIFSMHCVNVLDIVTVRNLPLNFEITIKVNSMILD